MEQATASWPLWAAFLGLVIGLLALDLGVFHRVAREISVREAIRWSVIWVIVGLGFSAVVYVIYDQHWFGAQVIEGGRELRHGPVRAVLRYVTGYLLEKSLSVDNLFVMAMLFQALGVPQRYRHRVLFWGVLGALVLRGLMIAGGVWLVHHFTFTFYIFGLWLLVVGLRLLRGSGAEPSPEQSWTVRLIRRIVPVTLDDHGQRLVVRTDTGVMLTRLGLALIAIEMADVVFALDSVPAVLAITTDPFLVFSSNVFAILGLRSLFFVLDALLERFRYLHMSLSFILVFIGSKMLLHSVVRIPNLVSLGVVLLGLVGGMVWSMLKTRNDTSDPASR